MTTPIDERRAEFDFEVEFSNGGALQRQGFRLDIDGDDIENAQLARPATSPEFGARASALVTRPGSR